MAIRNFNQIAVWPESILSIQSPKIIQLPAQSKSCIFYKSWGVILTDACEAYSVCLKSLKLSFLSDSIKSISCNSWMAVLISFTGQAFVVGNDPEEYGLLGIPDCFETSIRVILPGVKCTSVSVGLSHVALLDRNGTLYTWGSGNFGELGGEAGCKQQEPMIVTSAKIYSVKQVACGPGFTIFCTAGGFLYCYGQLPHCPYSNSKPSNPTTIKGLEKLFTQSIVSCDDFIAILTDTKDVFAIHGCLKLAKLPSKYKSIAGGKGVLFGITKDDNSLHEWRISNKSLCKLQTLEAKSYIFDQIFDETVNIYSGESFSIGFSSYLKVEGFPITKFYSTIRVVHELTANDLMELRRKSISSNPYAVKEAALKKMLKIHSHNCTQTKMFSFNEFKEFTKLKKYSMVNKSISLLINAISKVVQRNKVVLESKALKDICDYCDLQEQIKLNKKVENLNKLFETLGKLKKFIKKDAFKDIFYAFTKYLRKIEGLKVLEKVNLKRIKKRKQKGFMGFEINRKRLGNVQSALNILMSVDNKLLKFRTFSLFSKIFSGIRIQLNVINHIFFFCSEKSTRIMISKYFDLWKSHRLSSKREEISRMYATKTNARGIGMKIAQLLKKNCKFAWNSIKNYKKPVTNSKYGVIIVISCLKKFQARLKISAFKSIAQESKIKAKFLRTLKILLKKKFSSYFSSLQTYIEERKQYTLLKITLRLSSLTEKLNYKNLVKGFSKFKSHGLLNRSAIIERLNKSDIKINTKSETQRKPVKAVSGMSPTIPFMTVGSPIFNASSKNKSSASINKKRKIESSKASKNVSFTKLIKKDNKPTRTGSINASTEKDNFEALIDKIFENESAIISGPLISAPELSTSQPSDKYKVEEEDQDVKNKLGIMSLVKNIQKLISDQFFSTFTQLKASKKPVQRKLNLKFLESSEEEISDQDSEIPEEPDKKNTLWVEQLQSLGGAIVKKLLSEKLKTYFNLLTE